MCCPMSRCCVLHVVSMRVSRGVNGANGESGRTVSTTGKERTDEAYLGRPSRASSCVGMESSRWNGGARRWLSVTDESVIIK